MTNQIPTENVPFFRDNRLSKTSVVEIITHDFTTEYTEKTFGTMSTTVELMFDSCTRRQGGVSD